MSGQVSRGSAGEYQADEQAGVARLDGKILVNDPNSKSRTGKAYPLSTILNQSKTSSPFMICSPAN